MTFPANRSLDRRAFLRLGGGALAAGAVAGVGLPAVLRRGGNAASADVRPNFTAADINKRVWLAGTDGWMALPPIAAPNPIAAYAPDPLAPEGLAFYNYGFRQIPNDAFGAIPADPFPRTRPDGTAFPTRRDFMDSLKGETQNASPLLVFDEYDPDTNTGDKIQLRLSNLGWVVRPDIPDGHTLHWHGFPNAIPWFDGVPEMSAGAPIGKDLYYFYAPVDPGTFMYHCHWEDVEHIQMGMTGVVFVRPKQNRFGYGASPATNGTRGKTYAYNDGDGSTRYDREFAFILMDFDLRQHWKLAHIQQPDWTEYDANAWAINGRAYPDSLQPNTDPYPAEATTVRIAAGPTATSVRVNGQPSIGPAVINGQAVRVKSWSKPAGNNGWIANLWAALGANAPVNSPVTFRGDRLEYQPLSSRITCMPGEKVLLRFANLGYQRHPMTSTGIPLKVIGRDANLLRGADGTDLSFTTNVLPVAPGQAWDAIFTAPTYTGGSGTSGKGYDRYLIYDRDLANDVGGGDFGGLATEVHVFPAGTLQPQSQPNGDGGAAPVS